MQPNAGRQGQVSPPAFVSFFLCLSLPPSLCLYVFLSLPLSLSLCLPLSLSPFISVSLFIMILFTYLCIYWLHWVFVAGVGFL